MSWVFLTPDEVYKLKKPVRLPFLDFSTLAARRRNCQREVELNRRLAKGIYLGMEALSLDSSGNLQIGDNGAIVDWLVHMRRLPATRMLDNMIHHQCVDKPAVEEAAQHLAVFYRMATPVPYTTQQYRQRLAEAVEYNHKALQNPRYQLPQRQVTRVASAQQTLLRHAPEMFDKRIAEHRIIEAHGDLRPGHICLISPPVIIDCLEFNRELRLLDPLDELAYFSVECEVLGAASIAARFLHHYQQESGDRPPSSLLDFYRCRQAFLRTRLAAQHLRDDPRQRRNNWLAQASTYLNLAESYSNALNPKAR